MARVPPLPSYIAPRATLLMRLKDYHTDPKKRSLFFLLQEVSKTAGNGDMFKAQSTARLRVPVWKPSFQGSEP